MIGRGVATHPPKRGTVPMEHPDLLDFDVVHVNTVPYRMRSRAFPDHQLYARHRDEPSIVVTAIDVEKLAAAACGVRLLTSWKLALDQPDLSHHTVGFYLRSVRMMATYFAEVGLPTEPAEIGHEQLRLFFRDLKERTSAATAQSHYRNLHVFFGWCAAEGELRGPSPMELVDKIKVSEKAHAIFEPDDLRKLIDTCKGNGFEDRRDLAIIRVLMDNGVRVSGLAGLKYVPGDEELNDVYVSKHVLRVTLKGGRQFWAPIGRKAAAAIDRYIRARQHHPAAKDSDWLWLPVKTRKNAAGEIRLGAAGIGDVIERRAAQAGLPHASPHKFRRTMASTWDGDSLDLMHIGGWESLEMVRHYGRQGAERKAREAHRRYSPGDKI